MAQQKAPPRLTIITFSDKEYADALNLMSMGVQFGGMSVVHTASHMLAKFTQAHEMAKLVGGDGDRGLSRLGDRGAAEHGAGTSPGSEFTQGDQSPPPLDRPR